MFKKSIVEKKDKIEEVSQNNINKMEKKEQKL